MDTVEEYFDEMAANKCNIDILVNDFPIADGPRFAVRLRPWNREDKGTMILGAGVTVLDACEDAYTKAKRHRWEKVDWAARPWVFSGRVGNGW